MKTWQSSEAGTHLPTLLEAARGGDWQLVSAPGGAAALADAGELAGLLAEGHRFHPQVADDGQAIGVWLPELQTRGAGASADEAFAALADDMLRYAKEWQERLRDLAGHRRKAGYVRRIQLAADRAGVLALLEDDAQAAGEAAGGGAEAPEELDDSRPRRWMGPTNRIARMRAALGEPEE